MQHTAVEQFAFDFGDGYMPVVFPEHPSLPEIQAPPPAIAQVHTPAPPDPNLPRWSENAHLAAIAAGRTACVSLVKVGNKAVAAIPMDMQAAAMLANYHLAEPVAGELDELPSKAGRKYKAPPLVFDADRANTEGVIRCHLKNFKTRHDDDRVFFKIDNAIGATFEDSFLYHHLTGAGFDVVASPSLARWAPRAYRRRERETTAFELPEVTDSRPLFERAEVGLALRCTEAVRDFSKGLTYVVVETDDEADTLKLAQADGKADQAPLEWCVTDGDMGAYFEDMIPPTDVYNPENCIRQKYPELIAAMEKKLAKLGLNKDEMLFLHVQQDACQAALKRHVWLGNKMRMGKTSAAITIALLAGSERIVVVTPKNVRRVVVKELERLGIQDYRVIKSLSDMESPAKFHLISYNWLKGRSKKRRLQVREERKYQVGKACRYEFPEKAKCPHCDKNLVRPAKEYNAEIMAEERIWPEKYGYLCKNADCKGRADNREKEGAAWARSTRRRSGRPGYIDLGRKVHFEQCIQPEIAKPPKGEGAEAQVKDLDRRIRGLFKGRECKTCHYVEEAWIPANYRRVKKARYTHAVVDEIHNIKAGNTTDQANAIMSLRTRRRTGMTGTMMPNAPQDPYWPFHWIFVGGTHRFPYLRTGETGLTRYRNEFVRMALVHDSDGKVVSKKATPYVKDIGDFHRMVAPKMIRRSPEDPLVIESMRRAGLVWPEEDYHTLLIDPTPQQAQLMLASIDHFKQHYDKYVQEVEAAAALTEKPAIINSSRVLPLMMRMRVAATVPDRFNTQLAKVNCFEPIYTGPRGGGKMPKIRDLVAASRREGKKVVIFSFFREMQQIMTEELAEHGALRFDTSWDDDERDEAFERFTYDDKVGVFIGSPMSMGEGVDLAADGKALTAICADLLWVPGKMAQAWSRILRPLRGARRCEIYRLLTKASIDTHMWDVFYAKQIASEQAFDRRILSRKEKAIDIQAFVNRVLEGRSAILALLQQEREQELMYVPTMEMEGATCYADVDPIDYIPAFDLMDGAYGGRD